MKVNRKWKFQDYVHLYIMLTYTIYSSEKPAVYESLIL